MGSPKGEGQLASLSDGGSFGGTFRNCAHTFVVVKGIPAIIQFRPRLQHDTPLRRGVLFPEGALHDMHAARDR